MAMTKTPMQATRPGSVEDVLKRYPRLTAHLVCQSLGYFSPLSAARAILDHATQTSNACEWYIHMAGNGRSLLQVNRDTIAQAFRSRRSHRGYMADYPTARRLVETYSQPTKAPHNQPGGSW